MFFKASILLVSCAFACGSPIIFNQPYNNPPYLPNGAFLTPPRAITTLNTFVPRRLIPPAPPRPAVLPRVYDNPPSRVYTAPPIFRPIPPAPTTRRPILGNNTFNNNNINTPRYAFNYGVNDNRTGDIKNVEERLENGVVTGFYSLTEPDGTIRRVTYTADDVNGFVANVERTNQPTTAANNNANTNNNSPFTIFT